MKIFKLSVIFLLLAQLSIAAESIPYELKDIGIDENLGVEVNKDLMFRNEKNELVPLGSFFKKGKPVILTFAYYGCPGLCNLFLNGVTDAFKTFKWTPGKEFEIVTISIDPREDAELAAAKKQSHITELGRPEAAAGWHFLINDSVKKPEEATTAKALADQVGFKYRYDKSEGQYAHAAGMIFLTPTGKVSRYLFGIQFKEKDLQLALSEASGNRIGNVVDRLMLFCYNYDPKGRTYAIYALNGMRAAAFVTIVILGFWLNSFRKRKTNNVGQYQSERRL